jgi:hypothetical protein
MDLLESQENELFIFIYCLRMMGLLLVRIKSEWTHL